MFMSEKLCKFAVQINHQTISFIMKKIISLFCLLLCLTVGTTAQNITVSSAVGQSPATFVNTHLLGGGVYIYNAKFNNVSGNITMPQIGTFSANGYTGLVMYEGVLMTTGNIHLAPGPNNMTDASTPIATAFIDPAMESVATSDLQGCATLDFDFVGLSDTMSFNYCFASEEYPEYVCSRYNDVFAFFLTGPDPVTGEEVTRNIALIPNTVSDTMPEGIAVAINSVNSGSPGIYSGAGTGCYYDYSTYYNDNTADTSVAGIQYDGYTSKLTASARILPCETYHMHISLCNVGDNLLGSGVFIEGGSFTVPSDHIVLSRAGIDTVWGSCPHQVPLSLAGTPFEWGVVHYTSGGTAVEGTDYILTNDDGAYVSTTGITIGNTPRNIVLRVLPNVDLTHTKTIELYLETRLCPAHPQLVVRDTMRFVLVRGGDVRLRDTSIICSHACLEVSAPLVYGEPPITYLWQPTTGIDHPNHRVSTAFITESADYQLIATGGSGCHSDTAHVHVVVTGQDPVGIDELGISDQELRIHPNPASNIIHIDALAEVLHVTLYASNGRMVGEWPVGQGHRQVTIPTEGLDEGIYTVRVRTSKGYSINKVVIVR